MYLNHLLCTNFKSQLKVSADKFLLLKMEIKKVLFQRKRFPSKMI